MLLDILLCAHNRELPGPGTRLAAVEKLGFSARSSPSVLKIQGLYSQRPPTVPLLTRCRTEEALGGRRAAREEESGPPGSLSAPAMRQGGLPLQSVSLVPSPLRKVNRSHSYPTGRLLGSAELVSRSGSHDARAVRMGRLYLCISCSSPDGLPPAQAQASSR